MWRKQSFACRNFSYWILWHTSSAMTMKNGTLPHRPDSMDHFAHADGKHIVVTYMCTNTYIWIMRWHQSTSHNNNNNHAKCPFSTPCSIAWTLFGCWEWGEHWAQGTVHCKSREREKKCFSIYIADSICTSTVKSWKTAWPPLHELFIFYLFFAVRCWRRTRYESAIFHSVAHSFTLHDNNHHQWQHSCIQLGTWLLFTCTCVRFSISWWYKYSISKSWTKSVWMRKVRWRYCSSQTITYSYWTRCWIFYQYSCRYSIRMCMY